MTTDPDQLAPAVAALLDRHDGAWTGTAGDLLAALALRRPDHDPQPPITVGGLGMRLRHQADRLAAAGIVVRRRRRDGVRVLDVTRG